MNNFPKLSTNEMHIMNILWTSEKALTRGEILDAIDDRTWADPYIHTLLNSLLKKKVIEVDGVVQTTKNFGRTYKAAVSKDSYDMKTLNSLNLSMSSINAFVSSLIKNNAVTKEEVEELQKILKSYK